jgi:hypothetical protein
MDGDEGPLWVWRRGIFVGLKRELGKRIEFN